MANLPTVKVLSRYGPKRPGRRGHASPPKPRAGVYAAIPAIQGVHQSTVGRTLRHGVILPANWGMNWSQSPLEAVCPENKIASELRRADRI